MIPHYITLRELADLLCVSIRTAERRVREMKATLGMERWHRIPTERAIEYFEIPRYKIEKMFAGYKRIIEND